MTAMKRILSVITIVLMLFTMIPSMAFAEGDQGYYSTPDIKSSESFNQEQWEVVYEKLAVALIFGKSFNENESVPPEYAIWYLRSNDYFDEFIQEGDGLFEIKFEEIVTLVDKYFANFNENDLREWLDNYMMHDQSFSYDAEDDTYNFHMDYGYGPSFKFVTVNKIDDRFVLIGKVDKSENEISWKDYQFIITKTTEGYKISECREYVIPDCNNSNGEHEWDVVYTTDDKSTCSERGVKSIHCSNCNSLKNITLLPTTEHTWDDGVVNIPASEHQAGSIFYTCEVCGSVKEEIIEWKSSDAIKSVSIDKKLMSEGETANITVEMEEGYTAKWMYLYKPITGNEVTVYLNKNTDGIYVGSFEISNQTESGIWKVRSLTYMNAANEYKYLYNNKTYTGSYYDTMDFSAIDFEVVGTNADVTKPVLKEFSIDKKIVSAGETITISIIVDDENPDSSMSLYYETASGSRTRVALNLINKEQGLYQGNLVLDDSAELGIWKIDAIYLYDINDNDDVVYNSKTNNWGTNKIDLSSMDFEVVEGENETILPGKEESYIVIFKDGFGNTLSTQRVKNGEDAIEPPEPTNPIYLFAGWDTDYTNVKANLVVNAKWTDNPNATYDNEIHVGESFKISVGSSIYQTYEITCNKDIEYSYAKTGSTYTNIGGNYYGSTFTVYVNEAGSYYFYVKGSISTNTLTYKVKVNSHTWDNNFTIDKKPTCTQEGSKSIHCSICNESKDTESIPIDSNAHEFNGYLQNTSTCTQAGVISRECIHCGTIKEEAVPAKGHSVVKADAVAPTCTEPGLTEGEYCSECGKIFTAQTNIEALGHDIETVYYDSDFDDIHNIYCERCYEWIPELCTFDDGVITKIATKFEAGEKTFTCEVCGKTRIESVEYVYDYKYGTDVYRIAGKDRFETSIKVADTLKANMGVSKFDNIVIASGMTFADALPGSYLAAKKNAPILLIGAGNASIITDYVNNNLKAGGTVYVLGGIGVVPDAWVSGMSKVKRLGGIDRYDTNLKILKEAGVNDGSDILVCTGTNFADSLSASATGKPILLVGNLLTANQRSYLDSISGESYYMIGGTGAVNDKIMEECSVYCNTGKVYRLEGANRYETSIVVAGWFFNLPDYAVLAYGLNFPDGLSAGLLAFNMNAPLILTATGSEQQAVSYASAEKIKYGYVIGGSGLISDNSVRKIFGMSSSDQILNK